MLKITSATTVRREVSIRMPRDGSGFDKHIIRLDWRIVDKDQQDELQRRALDPLVRGDDETDEGWRQRLEEQRELLRQYERELMRGAIAGWPADKSSGLADDDGEPLPFTPDHLEALLKNPIILSQLVSYYRDMLAGKSGLGKS